MSRALYLKAGGAVYLGVLALVFLKLPYWALRYIMASWRPVTSWTWGESLYISLVRQLIPLTLSKTTLLTLDLTGDQEASFKPGPNATPVWVPKLEKPLTGELGEMMRQTGDRSVRVSGWWTGREHAKQPDVKGKVILFFHGGAFCFGDARPESTSVLNDVLAFTAELGPDDDSVPHKALSVEYRLSHDVSLPGMVTDALAAWRYLVEDCSHLPSNVVLAGDSAGATLALALTRYLINEKPFGEGAPAGLILYSPWVDLSLSYFYTCVDRFGRRDILTPKFLEYAAREALRGIGPDAALNIYASSLSLARSAAGDEFKGFPPTIVSAGEVETLIEENQALVKAHARSGVKIELHVEKDAIHSVNALPVGFGGHKKAAAVRHSLWLKALWA